MSVNEIPGRDDMPAGALSQDIDRGWRRRDDRDDDDYWESLWNHAERFAEENERDEP